MTTKELRKKTPNDLQKLLAETRAKLQRLKFELPSGKVKNVREVRALRKEIARILTIVQQ